MNDKEKLKAEHKPAAIKKRMSGKFHPSYLRDVVLGSIDGAVTTFAVVAGAAGGGFSPEVALTLGVANLAADGFSMAASNYQAAKSRRDEVGNAKDSELHHIRVYPEGEKEEIRQIFSKKGFEGETLEKIVETIAQNEKQWIDTMVKEELGMETQTVKPLHAAFCTMAAFVSVGLLPLIPFFMTDMEMKDGFAISAVLTGAAFFVVGVIKGFIVKHSMLRSGLQTFLMGSIAALLAFVTAFFLHAKG